MYNIESMTDKTLDSLYEALQAKQLESLSSGRLPSHRVWTMSYNAKKKVEKEIKTRAAAQEQEFIAFLMADE